MANKKEKDNIRLDEAARAGWLYYVAGHTQDEIAAKLGISRQSAQRLVSQAVSEKLIKVRLDHPIAHCMELSQKLKDKFGLKKCRIVPDGLNPEHSIQGIPQACASSLEKVLKTEQPKIITLGTGRVLRACIEQLTLMDSPQHKIVSLVGNIAPDGSASSYDVIMRIADKVNAPHYPMPLPVIASSVEERECLQQQKPIKSILQLASQTDVTYVGIGQMTNKAPLFQDGFITKEEMKTIVAAGAVGEIVGWMYDKDGKIIDTSVNARVASAPIMPNSEKIVFGIAAGKQKINAIFGAIQGHLINSLITNEYTAGKLLKM